MAGTRSVSRRGRNAETNRRLANIRKAYEKNRERLRRGRNRLARPKAGTRPRQSTDRIA